MAQTPEAKVKAAVRKLLVEMGVYYFSPASNGYGRACIPDIICCVNGRFLAIECKAGNGKTTALQDREIAAIQAARGEAVVVNEESVSAIGPLLKALRARAR